MKCTALSLVSLLTLGIALFVFAEPATSQDGKRTEAKAGAKPKRPGPGERLKGIRFHPVKKSIEGWTVHVDPAMLEGGEHAEEGSKALKMLANHLQRISILVPEDRLKKMKTLEIWIEHHHPSLGAMQYHPSVQWLKSNGHDPRLHRKVHVVRASALLSRGQMLKHPAVILHELAHAYHDQILSFNNKKIIDAFKKAEASKSYEKVLLFNGSTVRHYALSQSQGILRRGHRSLFLSQRFLSLSSAPNSSSTTQPSTTCSRRCGERSTNGLSGAGRCETWSADHAD